MQTIRRLFFNPYGWLIFILSIVTTFVLGVADFWWVLLLGIIGYQSVLIVEMTLGRTLGRSGTMILESTSQENRELRAEQARLLGAIQEREARIGDLESTAQPDAPSEP
jgi:hypothetical protein